MPRISTQTLAEHREWRRSQLIDAAAAIALESGAREISVSAVAQRAGLSRTSFYEYFSSSSEIAAELVIEELQKFSVELGEISNRGENPREAIELWIEGSLLYVADGRHLLAKALNSIELPENRRGAIGAAHAALLAPLKKHVEDLGVEDVSFALALIQGATDSATKQIERGGDAELVTRNTREFCIAGLLALTN